MNIGAIQNNYITSRPAFGAKMKLGKIHPAVNDETRKLAGDLLELKSQVTGKTIKWADPLGKDFKVNETLNMVKKENDEVARLCITEMEPNSGKVHISLAINNNEDGRKFMIYSSCERTCGQKFDGYQEVFEGGNEKDGFVNLPNCMPHIRYIDKELGETFNKYLKDFLDMGRRYLQGFKL